MQPASQRLIDDVMAILPVSQEDLLYKGIVAALSERIIELKRAQARLAGQYDTLQDLERRIESEGVSVDDHTLYSDLLEWRALGSELAVLARVLEGL
jgi:hypothetical protein